MTATPSIQHLRLADYHDAIALAPHDLPHLTTFRGTAAAAASVVPGRAVQVLGLVGHEFVTETDLERIAQSAAQIRWLDFNDCFLAAEWGHPSDNLGAILAVADYLARSGIQVTVRDVLEGMIKAHEIQGGLALLNSFNRVGLDHVVLVKVASTAVVSKLL